MTFAITPNSHNPDTYVMVDSHRYTRRWSHPRPSTNRPKRPRHHRRRMKCCPKRRPKRRRPNRRRPKLCRLKYRSFMNEASIAMDRTGLMAWYVLYNEVYQAIDPFGSIAVVVH